MSHTTKNVSRGHERPGLFALTFRRRLARGTGSLCANLARNVSEGTALIGPPDVDLGLRGDSRIGRRSTIRTTCVLTRQAPCHRLSHAIVVVPAGVENERNGSSLCASRGPAPVARSLGRLWRRLPVRKRLWASFIRSILRRTPCTSTRISLQLQRTGAHRIPAIATKRRFRWENLPLLFLLVRLVISDITIASLHFTRARRIPISHQPTLRLEHGSASTAESSSHVLPSDRGGKTNKIPALALVNGIVGYRATSTSLVAIQIRGHRNVLLSIQHHPPPVGLLACIVTNGIHLTISSATTPRGFLFGPTTPQILDVACLRAHAAPVVYLIVLEPIHH